MSDFSVLLLERSSNGLAYSALHQKPENPES